MSHSIWTLGFMVLLIALSFAGILAQSSIGKTNLWSRIPTWAIILGILVAVAIFVIPIFATAQ